MKKSGSRFQVARVNTMREGDENDLEAGDGDGADDKINDYTTTDELLEHGAEEDKSPSLPNSADTGNPYNTDTGNPYNTAGRGSISMSNGPESPGATFSISGDSYRSRGSIDVYNKTNIVMNTIEALPCVDHYRNIFSATGGGIKARPTLAELHEELDDDELRNNKKDVGQGYEGDQAGDSPAPGEKVQVVAPVKFGWIQGVLIRCVLNIFGVMLFIRLPWVVGNSGIIQGIVIILLSSLVTMITANSMTAICTNGEVKGGGAYYMISRSLGPEFGGAIGVIFSMANTVAVAMYVVGFAETVRDILKRYDLIMTDDLNDVRIIGSITIVILLAIAIVGMNWEARAQVLLLAILTLAILDYFVGLCIPASDEKRSQGFLGFNEKIFLTNIHSGYEDEETFFSVFAIFFPAATGILAGANISGDLKDASSSIPKGTFLAILITTIVYLLMGVFSACTFMREANGIMLVAPLVANNLTGGQVTSSTVLTFLANVSQLPQGVALDSLVSPAPNNSAYAVSTSSIIESTSASQVFTTDNYSYTFEFVGNCSLVKGGCKYGLLHSYQVVEMSSAWGPLILAGIFSATLSSALASLMSAPKVFQALCKDRIFPFLAFFGVGSGPDDNPRRGFLLCFFIALAFNLIADLNAIAPLISNFFLMSYALINFSCFDASIARSPGWRPSFRFYNKWLSLAGAMLCIGVMFIINWVTALVTFGCVGSLFMYVRHWKPDVNWGSSTQAHVYRNVLQSALKLIRIGEHIKNFRPQVLVLTGEPDTRPALVDFSTYITKKMGLMVCGNIIIGEQQQHLRKLRSDAAAYSYFRRRHVKSFYSATTAATFQLGAQALMQNVGVGKFRPNLLLMGFKTDWQTDDPQHVQQYLGIIHDAFDLKFGVGILRIKEGLGVDSDGSTTMFDAPDEDPDQSDDESQHEQTPPPAESDPSMTPAKGDGFKAREGENGTNGSDVLKDSAQKGMLEGDEDEDEEVQGDNLDNVGQKILSKLNTQVLKKMNKFRNKEKGTIDVWWLFDDGGLTLLLPYILSMNSQWRGCRFRIFSAGTKSGDLGYEQRQLATLLAKFRIDCKDMTVLPEINKKPSEESVKIFNSYLAPWRLDAKNGETKEEFPWKTTDDELEMLKEKTQRHIRLRELLVERSMDAALIVMTLPMPRKATCSAGLYMCWIDSLSRDMPPILLVRGNQESVLTFYS